MEKNFKRTFFVSMLGVLFVLANIFAAMHIPAIWMNAVTATLIVFLLVDGFLVAMDLKAAEQRIQDLNIFKSNQMTFLINKTSENNNLLHIISSRLLILEKKTCVLLSSRGLISADMCVPNEAGFCTLYLNNIDHKNIV
jgi:hypothetical protein